jgi:RpiR family transcriptional regulator, carbohydrate utilization regulator
MHGPRVSRGPVAAGIDARMASLNPSEAKVAAVLLALGDELIYRSASEVASVADASLSTVVRACQALGFRGFQDRRVVLAREGRPATPAEIQDDVQPGDAPANVLDKVGAATREAISWGLAHVDREAFAQAVEVVVAAERVLCLGVGTSATLAQDAAYRLMWLGVRSEAPADVHAQHVRATASEPGDAVLVVSHTGSTRETVTAARAASDSGATVVAVTSFARSPLTEAADLVLIAPSPETSYRVEAMTSRVAHITVLDALWVAVAVALGEDAIGHARRVNDVISDHRF